MVKRLFLLVVLTSLLAGCRTKYVAVPEVHTRDSVVLRLQRDSVYLRDSVFVNTYLKGDTVFVDKVKTTYLYKDRLRTDTVFVSKTDSVTVVQEIEKPLKWYDKVARWVALCAIGAVMALVVFLAMRK